MLLQGLKTGMYYLRTKPASNAFKFTVTKSRLPNKTGNKVEDENITEEAGDNINNRNNILDARRKTRAYLIEQRRKTRAQMVNTGDINKFHLRHGDEHINNKRKNKINGCITCIQ